MKQLLYSLLLCLLAGSLYAQQQFAVYFDTDEAVPQQKYTTIITQWITQNPNAVVTAIEGYADYRGTNEYNALLSERRAQNVLKLLEDNGTIIINNVPITGKGEVANTAKLYKNRKAVIYYRTALAEVATEEESELSKKIAVAKVGDRINVPGLNFYENSTTMVPASHQAFNDLREVMEQNPTLKIKIDGHVCCQPENEEKLSWRRAKAVYDLLIDSGIDMERLKYEGFGSTRPLYPLPENNYAEINANRRVEIEIMEK